MKFIKKFEGYGDNSMSRDEMVSYLGGCGCDVYELDSLSDEELMLMCNVYKEMPVSEANKWIQSDIKRPGSLRKLMGKKRGEKITDKEIDRDLKKLRSKDNDPKKPGVQGLNKKDLNKFRKLNLAKTLKGLKEGQDSENYMFFANLENIVRMCNEILQMNSSDVDSALSDGHAVHFRGNAWAVDHISTSKDDIEEVYQFLKSHNK